jgi:hypothetical protein
LLWGMRVLPAVAGIFVVGRVGGDGGGGRWYLGCNP